MRSCFRCRLLSWCPCCPPQNRSRIFKTSAGQMMVTRETVGLKPGPALHLKRRPDGCRLRYYYEPAAATGQQRAISGVNCRGAETAAAFFFFLPTCDGDFGVYRNRLSVRDVQFSGDGTFFRQLGNFAHRFVQQNCDHATMRESRASGITRTENKFSRGAFRGFVQFKRELHSGIVRAAAAKTMIGRIRSENEFGGHLFLRLFSRPSNPHFKPMPRGCVPRGEHRVAACAFRHAEDQRASRLRAPALFHSDSRSPDEACSASAIARRNNARARRAGRAPWHGSKVRLHRTPAEARATGTCHLRAACSPYLPACTCAGLRPSQVHSGRY